MRECLFMYARYSLRANASVAALLDGLSPEARAAERGAYYGSLASLFAHLADGSLYFLSLFRSSYPGKFPSCESVKDLKAEGGAPGQAGWDALKAVTAKADEAVVELASSATESDMALPVKLDWYGGKPAQVPLHFLFNQLVVHGIHHRGQISQILDEMKVEHDFSGIDLEFLP
jgi:uncharacterized damage-inducible protein DinB